MENIVKTKPSFWANVKDFFYSATDIFHRVQAVCCFLSILATVGFILGIAGVPEFISVPIYVIGLVSALLSCPLKWILLVGAAVVKGFLIGLFFLLVGSLVGAGIGFTLIIMLFFLAPAIFTIHHYFTDLRYKLY